MAANERKGSLSQKALRALGGGIPGLGGGMPSVRGCEFPYNSGGVRTLFMSLPPLVLTMRTISDLALQVAVARLRC